MKLKLIVILLTTSLTPLSHAADYCVTNAQELQSALDQASNSAESNHIKLVSGQYHTSDNGLLDAGFTYSNGLPAPLTISGGWNINTDGDCVFDRVRDSAIDTVLSGGGENRVLHIAAGQSGAIIHITNLSIAFGQPNSPFGEGGGLLIRGHSSQDKVYNVLLDRVFFAFNQAHFSSALFINSANRVDVKNSLFLDNTVNISHTASIHTDGYETIYFTNNTVVHNETLSNDGVSGVLLHNLGSGGSVAANNIFWNNTQWDVVFSGSSANHHLLHNIYQSATGHSGIDLNNIHSDPLLLSTSYAPSPQSPAINAGLTPPENAPNPPVEMNWTVGEYDFQSHARTLGLATDLGAMETIDDIFGSGFE